MNLKYHVLCGVVLEYALPSNGMMLLVSIIPDLTLIKNEYNIIKYKKKFNENDVTDKEFKLYMICHSVFITIILSIFNVKIAFSHLLHISFDWFTHIGRFTAMPLYPIKYKFKYGRNILK